MTRTDRVARQGLEARVLARQAGLYPGLRKDIWYRVRPDGRDEDGWCWLVGYGVRQKVSITDFEFQRAE